MNIKKSHSSMGMPLKLMPKVYPELKLQTFASVKRISQIQKMRAVIKMAGRIYFRFFQYPTFLSKLKIKGTEIETINRIR